MRRIISIFVLILIIIGLLPQNTFAVSNTGYFVVTAYYSPLPNQKSYLTGNYESEIRLNGQGIAGASGKKVFSGMLAGPKTYAFGTKIYLEGLGVGEISDRGGAIVSAGNRGYSYDRLDIWVGYGDEGLQRALYWGKRTVKGNIISNDSKVSLDYTKMPAPNWTTTGLKPKEDVFSYSLGVGSDSSKVKKLQQFLKDLKLYNGNISGEYNNEIISIIYNFQVENEILSSPNDIGAGYWGNITRDKFKKAYLNGEFDDLKNDKIEIKNDQKLEVKSIEVKKENNELSIFENALSGAENTKKLQEILKELSLYDGEITGNYKDTINVIYDFQINYNIINNKSDIGAGNFGPKTRTKLKEVYVEYKEKLALEEAIRLEEEKRRKNLEDKYRELEKSVIEEVDEKIKNLLGVRFGEVSPRVRNLQLTLKELGYFSEKDTAIYGEKTKNSLALFQLENDLIDSLDSQYAGVLGERTFLVLKRVLEEKYLDSKLNENIDLLEFVSVINSTSL